MDAKYAFLLVFGTAALIAVSGSMVSKQKAPVDTLQHDIAEKLHSQNGTGGLGGNFSFDQGQGLAVPSPETAENPYIPTNDAAGVSASALHGVMAPGAPAAAYTPPAPLSGPPVTATHDTTPSFYLKNNQRIFFTDQRVLALGSDGTLRPLPDGAYELKNGETILIKNGKRQLVNNAAGH